MSTKNISHKQLWPENQVFRNESLKLVLDLVNQELAGIVDRDENGRSLFFGSPHVLGYYAGGMLMIPFVQWIIQVSKEMGLKDLYFLARDGHIIKRVYDLLSPYHEDAPTAHYLLASRRAFNNASIRCDNDITDSLVGSFLAGSPKSILRSRFGVSWNVKREADCLEAGFLGGDALCDFDNDDTREKLSVFMLSQSRSILNQAQAEREALSVYLKDSIRDLDASAVVDIGHSGSLQKSLQILTGNQNIAGIYFLTFAKAAQVHSASAPVRAWFGEFINPASDYADYCKNIGMFEFLFLNDEASLSHFTMDEQGGGALPVYVQEPASDRQSHVAQVHDGIEKFTRDLMRELGERMVGFSLEPDVATRAIMEFVCRPSRADAEMFSNVLFFDGYAGEATHRLVAQSGRDALQNLMNLGEYLENSWWKPGAWVLLTQDDGSEARAKWLHWLWSGPVGRVARRLRKIRGL